MVSGLYLCLPTVSVCKYPSKYFRWEYFIYKPHILWNFISVHSTPRNKFQRGPGVQKSIKKTAGVGLTIEAIKSCQGMKGDIL